jgi:hypothetical protein
MIIRHEAIRNTSFNDQPQVLSNWFSALDAEVRGMVQPVSIPDPAPTPGLLEASLTWESSGWIPTNFHLPEYLEAAADVTTVNLSGTAQAFALSFADVVHLSTET